MNTMILTAAAVLGLVTGAQAQNAGDACNSSGAIGGIIFLTIIFWIFGGRKFVSWLLFVIFGPFIIWIAVVGGGIALVLIWSLIAGIVGLFH